MLTIGLPFYNDEHTLGNAIRSVFAQTYTDWELLLVDDGSTDDSLEVASSVNDPRVRVISDHSNQGLAARLNQIADLAQGRFIARMDADDLMDPSRLIKQIKRLEENPHLDLVDTGLLSLDSECRPMGVRCCQPLDVSRVGLFAGQIPVHASVVARANWYRDNRYNDSLSRAQDFELWNRAHANSSLKHDRITEPLYFAREPLVSLYRKAQATNRVKRHILKQLGPANVGWSRTRVELFRTNAKQAAHFVASQLGMERRVAARRNRPLPESAKARFLAIVDDILQTRVPGLISKSSARQERQTH